MKNLENVKKVLINVDMVNGFVNFGAMHDKYINHVIPVQITKMEEYEQNTEYLNVIVKDTHKEN